MLQANVVRPKVIESTSLGAAYLAGLAVGYWKDAKEIKKYWKQDKVFYPKMPEQTTADLYKGWLAAVKRTLSK